MDRNPMEIEHQNHGATIIAHKQQLLQLLIRPDVSEDISQKRYEKALLKKFSEALDFLANEQHAKGIKFLEELLKETKNPVHFPLSANLLKFKGACHLNISLALLEIKENQKAIFHLAEYSRLFPNDFKRSFELGNILISDGFLKSGIVVLQKSLNKAIAAKEVQFASIILDRLVDGIFIVNRPDLLQTVLAQCQNADVFKSMNFESHREKLNYLKFYSNTEKDVQFQNFVVSRKISILLEKQKILQQKEQILNWEYWQKIGQKSQTFVFQPEENDDSKNKESPFETISIRGPCMISLIFKIGSFITKVQFPPSRSETPETSKSKRQSQEAVKTNFDLLATKKILFEFEKNEKRQSKEQNFEEIEEPRACKKLDEFVVPKITKILGSATQSHLSRLLSEIGISLRSMFDFESVVSSKKKSSPLSEKSQFSILGSEKNKLFMEFFADLNQKTFLEVLQITTAEIFEERLRSLKMNDNQFIFFGPHIFLKREFKNSANDFFKLFNFIFESIPGILKFESLLVYLEMCENFIPDNSKKGHYKSFLKLFQKLEELYLSLDKNYIEEKAKRYVEFCKLKNKNQISFSDFLREKTSWRQKQNLNFETEENKTSGIEIIEINDDFDFIPANQNPNLKKMELELDFNSHSFYKNFQTICIFLQNDLKSRFWTLKQFEHKIKQSTFERFNEEKVANFISSCKSKLSNFQRSNIEDLCFYWVRKSVIKIDEENCESLLSWLETKLSIDHIEFLHEMIEIDFVWLNFPVSKMGSGKIYWAHFLPKLIRFLLDFIDRNKKGEPEKFEFVYDILKSFLQLEKHLNLFSMIIKKSDSTQQNFEPIYSNSGEFLFLLLKLFLVQYLMDKKQTSNDAKLTLKVLLNHKLYEEHRQNYFIVFQAIHCVLENSSFVNIALVNFTCKPIRKMCAINSLNYLLSSLKIDNFPNENKEALISRLHLLIFEIRRFFECFFQTKLNLNIFLQIIKANSNELFREINDSFKDFKFDYPKIRSLCIFVNNESNLQSEKRLAKQMAEGILAFSTLVKILSKGQKIEELLFSFSENTFGEQKGLFQKVSIVLEQDFHLDSSLFSLCQKIFSKHTENFVLNFHKLFQICADHPTIKLFLDIKDSTNHSQIVSEKNLDFNNQEIDSRSQIIEKCLEKLSPGAYFFLLIGMRFAEHDLISKLFSGDIISNISASYSLMSEICEKAIQVHEATIDHRVGCVLVNSLVRFNFQLACLEPLELAFKLPLWSARALEVSETQILHYLIACQKLGTEIKSLVKLNEFFPSEEISKKICELENIFHENIDKGRAYENFFSYGISKRMDHILIFYLPEILVSLAQGKAETLGMVLENFFAESKERAMGEYTGTFKSLFENKKGEKFLVYKAIAYARISVQLFLFYHEQILENEGRNSGFEKKTNEFFDDQKIAESFDLKNSSTEKKLEGNEKAFQISENSKIKECNQNKTESLENQIKDQNFNQVPINEECRNLQSGFPLKNAQDEINSEQIIPQIQEEILPKTNFQAQKLPEIIPVDSSFSKGKRKKKEIQILTIEDDSSNNSIHNHNPTIRTENIFEENPLPANFLSFEQFSSHFWICTEKSFGQKFSSVFEGLRFLIAKIIQNVFQSKKFSSQLFFYFIIEILSVAFEIYPALKNEFGPVIDKFFAGFKKIEIITKEKDSKSYFFEVCFSRKLMFLQFSKFLSQSPEVIESFVIASLKLIKTQDYKAGDFSLLSALLPVVEYLKQNPQIENVEIFRTIWSLKIHFSKHFGKQPILIDLFNFLLARTLNFIFDFFCSKKTGIISSEDLREFGEMCSGLENWASGSAIDIELILRNYKNCRMNISKHFMTDTKEK